MPNDYQQQHHQHDHQHQQSRDEIDTRVINNIFPSNSTSYQSDTRRTASPNLQQDPHLLSAVRDSVHIASPGSTESSSHQSQNQYQRAGAEMRRSNSPFDDKYATENSVGTTVVDQPAGQPHNQLGGIIHASGESSGVVGKERVRFDRSA